MKKLYHFQHGLILICLASITLGCGSGKSSIVLNNQDALIYEVTYDSSPIEMLVELNSRTPDLVLKYRMGFAEPKFGTITVTSDALSAATEQDNFWIGDKTLINKTTLWISSSTYDDIILKGEATMPFRQGFTLYDLTYTLIEKGTFEIVFNGKSRKLPVLYLEDKGGKGFKYWIWNNPSDPVILKMDLGWVVDLKEIIHL